MNNKIYYLLICFTLIFSSVEAQQWLDLLPKNKSKQELTLKDHKQAFDAYWKPFNVKNGYYYENGVKRKAYGWKPFMRWYYEMESQVNPQTGAFPKQTALEVYQQFKKEHRSLNSDVDQASWQCLGTDFSESGYSGIGRINTVAFHPTDNNTYWVGTPGGGLWRTTNDGDTWTCLTENTPILSFSDIVIPSDYATSQTIYIGTGDRDSWRNRGIGVLKSTDGGATWNTTGLQFELSQDIKVNRLLLDPNDNQSIIAATTNGLYKTSDGGDNWSELASYAFIDLEYHPNNFSTLYGSTKDGFIYQSTDGGNNWTEVFNEGKRIELAVTTANPDLVIALVSRENGGLKGLYKSEDSGNSFTSLFNGIVKNLLSLDLMGSDPGGQGWYDLTLDISPIDANKMLVGGINTWKSDNGGTAWSLSNAWHQSPFANEVHADKHCLKFRENGDLFECNDGGIYFSGDNGESWQDKSNGLIISQMYKLGVSALDASRTLMGLQDNGWKLLDNGVWSDVTGGDGMECVIDYTNSDIQYAGGMNGTIRKTTNNWVSSEGVAPFSAGMGAWVTPYIMSPSDHNTLYAGYADVWKTADAGTSWTKISEFNSADKIRTLAIAPSQTSVLYASDLSTVWKTTDDGATWTELTVPWENTSSVRYITVKNDDANHIWVCLNGYNTDGVYESTDGGMSWNNISEGLPEIPVHTLVQDVRVSDEIQLYAGTELGVYFKKGNDNWVEFNSGLPNVRCGELEIYYGNSSNDSRLRLASYGRGLWETPLVYQGTNIKEIDSQNNIKLYPNPTKDNVNIDLGEDYRNVQSVSVSDNLGKTLILIKDIDNSLIQLPTKKLLPGVYFVNVLKNNEKIVLELLIIK